MDRATQSMARRLVWGGLLNLLWMVPTIAVISDQAMGFAGAATGAPFSWPQELVRPSSVSEGARNGYVLVVVVTMAIMMVSSGILGGVLGASPGKTITGIRYGTTFGASAGPFRMLWRAILVILAVAPLLLVWPALGFVYGAEADIYAIAAIAFGGVFALVALFPLQGEGSRSLVNQLAGLRPYRRQRN